MSDEKVEIQGLIATPLTNFCNLRCIMCGSQNMEEKVEKRFVSNEVWLALMKKLPKEYGIEINSLGEHTLHPQFLDIIEMAVSSERYISLATNGNWTWGDSQTKKLMELMNRNTTSGIINFSVDGGTKEVLEEIRRGANFERVIANVRMCIEALPKDVNSVGISYCLNLRNLYEMSTLMDQLPGLSRFYINLLQAHSSVMFPYSTYLYYDEVQKEIARVIEYGEKKGIVVQGNCLPVSVTPTCNYPHYLWMDLDGNIYPCCRRYDVPLGNIVAESWDDIVARSDRFSLKDQSCVTCLMPSNAWSWQRHFSTKKLYREFLDWYPTNSVRHQSSLQVYRDEINDLVANDYQNLIDIHNRLGEKNNTLIYTLRVFMQHRNCIAEHVEAKHVVEVGYGYSKAMGWLFSHAGIEYIGLESLREDVDHPLTYQVLGTWSMALGFKEGIERPQPRYLNEMSEIPDEWADAVFSQAVLEHVDDVPGLLAQISRVLRPGGVTIHQIDLRNHLKSEDEAPDAFLKIPKDEWEYRKYLYSSINRLRAEDYKRLFLDFEFEIIKFNPSDEQGLKEGSLFLICRKPER